MIEEAVVDDAVVVSLLSAITMCTLEAMRKCIPEHSKKARTIKKVEESIYELSKLHKTRLNEDELKVGISVHNRNVEFILSRLSDEYIAVREGRQLVLFDGEYGRNKYDESVFIGLEYTRV